ncbi:hypothetical protein JOF56_003739 [Kibdelosporangium banguiense]|uniref:HK97 gp10 family phage protein n=1 Tax=Kibdelosporangium banguiense TaxID=1365924 RepID=A0ABS4TG05_9PSEU|nr:hypothetical protein [Kibdelosporangium banguiense]MBP2323354.1 hypothetical protein [Kibdelosporangium banguiense]
MSRVHIDARALAEIMRSDEAVRFMGTVGRQVRDRARANAKSVVPPPGSEPAGKVRRDAQGRFVKGTDDPIDAIIAVPGKDEDSAHVDVGYSKHHPGFYLWWWEVGTQNHPARPHLRPALRPNG